MINELTVEKASLPIGWEIKKLGEVCDLKSGKTISKSIERSEGEILYIKVGDMNLKGNENYIQVSNRFVDENDINSNQIIPIGSIIFPKRGGAIATNKKRRIVKPTIVDLNTMALVPSEIIDHNFLFHWFQKIDLAKLSNGANIPQINNYSFDEVSISYPKSLTQQKQIVSILDKAFAAIDTAKANAEQNLQNSKELFESYLQNMFENKGDDWEEKKIEDLSNEKKAIVSGPFGSNLKVADYRESGVPMIRLQNIGKGFFIDKSIKYVDPSKAEELKSHSFKTGDIVLAKLGIPIGKTCIIPDYFGSGIIVADIVRIRPDKKTVDFKFVEYFLNTDLSVSQLNKNISGATRPRVNLSDVRNIIIPIPSIDKQKQIVQKLDTLSAECNKLEAIYTQKITDLEEMKKSVLQKAFSGQLTT